MNSGRRLPIALLALGAWAAVWYAPWQGWLADWPALRTVIALAALIAPGAGLQHLVSGSARRSLAGTATLGFATSLAVVALLAGLALLVAGGFAFVVHGVFAVAVAGLVAWGAGVAPRRETRADPAARRPAAAMLVGAALLVGGAFALATAPVGSDDLTETARVTSFLQAERLSMRDPIFADAVQPPRFWLAYWPLAAALLARTAALPAVLICNLYLPPLLMALALLAVLELARGLGLSTRLAAVAVAAHVGCLLLTLARDQPGWSIFRRLDEDKIVAATVLVPVLCRAAQEYLVAGGWSRLVMLALSGIALATTHATMLGLGAAIAILQALLGAAAGGSRRRAGVAVAVLSLLCLPQIAMRFVPHRMSDQIHASLDSAQHAGPLSGQRSRRLLILGPGPWYAVRPRIYASAPFAALLASVLLAGWRWRASAAARYLIASGIVIASACLPLVAALLGVLVTPFHIWRTTWMAPFGIAVAYLAAAVVSRPEARRRLIGRWADALIAFAGVALIGLGVRTASTLTSIPRPPNGGQTVVHIEERRAAMLCTPTAADLTAVSRALDATLSDVVSGIGDASVNDLLPSLSARVSLVAYRNLAETSHHGNIDAAAARERRATLERLRAPETPADVRLRLLRERGIEILLLCSDPQWMAALERQFPAQVRLLTASGPLRLYRVILPPDRT